MAGPQTTGAVGWNSTGCLIVATQTTCSRTEPDVPEPSRASRNVFVITALAARTPGACLKLNASTPRLLPLPCFRPSRLLHSNGGYTRTDRGVGPEYQRPGPAWTSGFTQLTRLTPTSTSESRRYWDDLPPDTPAQAGGLAEDLGHLPLGSQGPHRRRPAHRAHRADDAARRATRHGECP